MRKLSKSSQPTFSDAVEQTLINTAMHDTRLNFEALQHAMVRAVFERQIAKMLDEEIRGQMSQGTCDDEVLPSMRTRWLMSNWQCKLTPLQWRKALELNTAECARNVFDQLAKQAAGVEQTTKPDPNNNGYNHVPFMRSNSNVQQLAPVAGGRISLRRAHEILADFISDSKVIHDNSDYTVHRPGSETSPNFKDPYNNLALQREQEFRRKGKVTKVDDKTNDPDAITDIHLVRDHGVEDELTGQVPFEDNRAAGRTGVSDRFTYRGDGTTRQSSDRAIWFDGLNTCDLKTMSGTDYREESREFLLKSVLPRLTRDQSMALAKAFMAHDDEGVREMLELVHRRLPYMTLRK